MIHICFNLDEKYVMPCKVLMRQIDAKTSEEITYHLIGISSKNMGTKNKCKFYPNPDLSYFNDDNLGDYMYFSQAAMYRLLIPFLIKSDRAIYMDCDMVVMNDLKLLWDKEIDLAGAVKDPCSNYHKKRLGIDSDIYFNSGLILFNSKKIRETMPDYKERILQAQKDYKLELKDQDIFNIVFKDKTTSLGYEFNIDSNNAQDINESEETIKAKKIALDNPVISHCMGKEKWWNFTGLRFGDYWDSYAGSDKPANRKTCYRTNGFLVIRS